MPRATLYIYNTRAFCNRNYLRVTLKDRNLTTLLHVSLRIRLPKIAQIAVESAVKYSFVSKGIQTRLKAQYNAD